jgi:hypothetical protein
VEDRTDTPHDRPLGRRQEGAADGDAAGADGDAAEDGTEDRAAEPDAAGDPDGAADPEADGEPDAPAELEADGATDARTVGDAVGRGVFAT